MANKVEKNWVDVVIHHMMESKKNTFLPYIELVTKILVYTGYDLERGKSDIRRSRVGKITLSKMRFIIKNEELFQLPLKIAQRPRKQQEDTDLPHSPSSNYIINNLLQNQQEMIKM